MSEIGNYLKQLRKKHNNERLIDMAQKINISVPYLSSIENGNRPLTDKIINRIIDVYKLSEEDVEDLFYFRNKESKALKIPLDQFDEEQKDKIIRFLSSLDDENN
jgi:transcriptional regulator with XRE-family HTH domain